MSEQMRPGRQCAVCSGDRAAIEAALTDGQSISAISATWGMSRSSVRRHLTKHMVVDPATASAAGLDAASLALRVQQVAERAREVAEDALDAGAGAQAIRAGDGELRALTVLAAMGVKHETALQELGAYRTMTHAVIRAARRNPEVAEVVAAQLDLVDELGYAADLRSQIHEPTKGLSS